jgi:predicted kinase
MIVIVFGLPASGKSYFATRVAQMLSATYISSDRIRKELFASPSYSSQEKILVYNEMLRRAIQATEHGKDVVLDGTFYTNNLREKFIRQGLKTTHVFLIEIFADEDMIKERLAMPREHSDADFKVYQSIKKTWEPVNSNQHLVLQSTNNNITEMLEQTADYLFLKNDKAKH